MTEYTKPFLDNDSGILHLNPAAQIGDIYTACKALLQQAKKSERTLRMCFNRIIVEANPKHSVPDIFRQWENIKHNMSNDPDQIQHCLECFVLSKI